MKNFFQKSVILLAAVTLLLGGCTKLSNTELLTAEPWKLTDLTSADADPDLVAFSKAFLSLATFDYMDGGTFTISYADSSITSDGGTWKFSDDESQLLQTQTGEPEETFEIITLDEDNLSYSWSDSTGNYTFSWGH